MAVVIKDMDMPETCYRCKFFNDSSDYPTCRVNDLSAGYAFNFLENRMDHCPLEPTVYIEND